MAGVSGNSTKQVLENIKEAIEAGADYGLLLPAAYFGKATTPAVVERFYTEVAERSDLPLVIYNFPGVCNGVDLDSDLITNLAKKLPGKIVGVKLTCGSVAKVLRLSASLPKTSFANFGGQSDFLIGGLASGSSGCICAFGNVMPKSIVRIYNLYQEGKMEEAMELHRKAALAEQAIKSGIAATKYAASLHTAKAAGIENAEELLNPRSPYEAPGEEAKKIIREMTEEMGEIEDKL
jgi:4-hydroxy-2-oxoglutarate aldolase